MILSVKGLIAAGFCLIGMWYVAMSLFNFVRDFCWGWKRGGQILAENERLTWREFRQRAEPVDPLLHGFNIGPRREEKP